MIQKVQERDRHKERKGPIIRRGRRLWGSKPRSKSRLCQAQEEFVINCATDESTDDDDDEEDDDEDDVVIVAVVVVDDDVDDDDDDDDDD
ncbi:hypothetical protein PoB_003528900 [Plakobranchus ocellatus]|uniref:Uncharacterized protein n=1 Tax=Plakobranchus ocellatus TaxID=259542 RepID=A0AAV4AR39_9GAST|nr:hypothetical protein PoB_003528900 [Plakobranchus ocellatus]